MEYLLRFPFFSFLFLGELMSTMSGLPAPSVGGAGGAGGGGGEPFLL